MALKTTINTKNNIMLLVFTLYLCTLFIYSDFGIRLLFGFAFVFVFLFYSIIKSGKIHLSNTILRSYFIILIAVVLAFFRTTSRIDKDTAMYVVSMVMCFCVVCSAEPNAEQMHSVERIVFTFAFVFAAIVILSRVARGVYLSTIYKLLTKEAQEASYSSIWHGYSCTIGGDDTFHNYFFMFATAFSLGHIAERKKGLIQYYVLALFFTAASFLTGRRGEFLVLFLICVFVGLCIIPKKQRKRIIAITLVLILCAVPFLPKLFNSSVFSRFAVTLSQLQSGADTLSGRLELWSMAFGIFLEHPLIGIGWGGFSSYVSDEFRALHGNVYNAHNIYLQFLAETGIVGFVLIVGGLLYLLTRTIRQSRLLRYEKGEKAVLRRYNSVSISIQVYFLLVGMLDPCFMKYYYWGFLSMAIIFYQYVENRRTMIPVLQ